MVGPPCLRVEVAPLLLCKGRATGFAVESRGPVPAGKSRFNERPPGTIKRCPAALMREIAVAPVTCLEGPIAPYDASDRAGIRVASAASMSAKGR